VVVAQVAAAAVPVVALAAAVVATVAKPTTDMSHTVMRLERD
jgi:hypothetical protein